MRHGFMCNAEELVRLSRFKSIISTRLAVTMICFGISTIIILSTEPFWGRLRVEPYFGHSAMVLLLLRSRSICNVCFTLRLAEKI